MFRIALVNVLCTLLYVAPGYLLCRFRRATADHLPSLSAVLIYICSPCLPVSAFLDLDFSWDLAANMGLFFVATLLIQGAFMAFLFLLFRRRHRRKPSVSRNCWIKARAADWPMR